MQSNIIKRRNALNADNFGSVVVTGGFRKNLAVINCIKALFPNVPLINSHELDHAVSYGAALKSQSLYGLNNSFKIQVKEVIHREISISSTDGIAPVFEKNACDDISVADINSNKQYRVTETSNEYTATIGKISRKWFRGFFQPSGMVSFSCDDNQIVQWNPILSETWITPQTFIPLSVKTLNKYKSVEASFSETDEENEMNLAQLCSSTLYPGELKCNFLFLDKFPKNESGLLWNLKVLHILPLVIV